MNIIKPNRDHLKDQSLFELFARWLLSYVKGTPEYTKREMEKNKKY